MRTATICLKGRLSEGGPTVTVSLPEDFNEACEAWGETKAETVFAQACKAAALRFAKARFAVHKNAEDTADDLLDWQPGTRAPRAPKQPKSPVSKTLKALAKLSPAELAELQAQLASDSRFQASA